MVEDASDGAGKARDLPAAEQRAVVERGPDVAGADGERQAAAARDALRGRAGHHPQHGAARGAPQATEGQEGGQLVHPIKL